MKSKIQTCFHGLERTPTPERTHAGAVASFLSVALLLASMLIPEARAAAIQGMDFSSLPGNRVQVRLTLSEPVASAPLNFTIDNPARIAVDFPGTTLNLQERARSISVGKVESVNAVEAGGRSRVVVNLVELVPYAIETSGNVVTMTLEGVQADITSEKQAQVAVPASAPAGTSLPAPTVAAPTTPISVPVMTTPTAVPAAASPNFAQGSAGARLEAIDFRRGARGEGLVVVTLSNANAGINIEEQGDKLIIDFVDAELPEALDRKLDVMDFATPAQEIDTVRHGNGARMIITPIGLYEHMAYQANNTFTLELRPLTKEEEAELKKDKFGYTGERLSLNFQDIEVRAILQLIADFTGFNLVTSDTVSGSVTLRLKNVPWDQAMDIILKTKGLGKRESGNVWLVAPQEEIAAREKLELESQKQIRELAPLKTEFVQINYAKASEIAALVKAESNNLLTERGNVTVDERTNTLLIQDTAEALTDIRRVVQALDIPVRQVLIESRIVVANEDFSRDIGVRFGLSHRNNSKEPAIRGDGNSGFLSVVGGGTAGEVDYGKETGFATGANENYIVDLPVTNPAGALRWSIGKVGSYLLQLELSALQVEGRGEVIASPQVITANQKEATIKAGTEIPYQQASSAGNTNVTFKEAVLSLKVTPHITPDDRVIMDLTVNRDSVGQVFAGVPSIDTNEVTTQVLVDNGETVVLGGIFESNNRTDKDMVPFFGEIPYIGNLFKRTAVTAEKQELLIFVTPKILKETLSISAY